MKSDESGREDRDDEVLEKNVEGLLSRGHEPPRPTPKARARMLAKLKERIAGPGSGEGTSRGRRRERTWAIVVAVVSVLGLLWLSGRGGFGLGEPEPPRLENPQRLPRSIALDDGSTVVLRGGARLARLGPRHLRLEKGEALFEVAPAEQPFVVEAPGGRAVALGTRFLLQKHGEKTRAAVARGTVRLESERGEATLGAGEEATLSATRSPVRRPAPRLSYLAGWAREARRDGAPGVGREPAASLVARMPGWSSPGQELPLPMTDLTVDVHVENQVARVAIDQTFQNPRPWQLEGVYRFPLPPDAAISRLAMYVDGELREAGIVERRRGRRIYNSIVYRRRDPALLEWMAANVFRVRVFPLPPRAQKRILLSYTQALPRLYDDVRLEVPIPAVDRPVGRVHYRVRLVDCEDCEVRSPSHPVHVATEGSDRLVTFEAKHREIGDDLVLLIHHRRSEPGVAVYDAGEQRYFLARARPDLREGDGAQEGSEETSPAAPPRRWVILDDTSASRRGLEREAQVHFIDQLLGELGERDQVALLAFDATVREMAGGLTPLGQLDRKAARRFLEKEGKDGVGYTDLGEALERAGELLDGAGDGEGDDYQPYILYVGDGLVTGGERDLDHLRALVRGRATVVGVGVGETRDRATLRALASETGGLVTSVSPSEDLDWRAFDLVAALNTPRVTSLEAELVGDGGRAIEGDVYLSSPQLCEGEEIAVVARASGAAGLGMPRAVRLRGRLDGRPWRREIALDGVAVETGAGYLPRLWAQRRIEDLIERGAEQNREEITRLGLDQWLVTPFTSLLVLESRKMEKEQGVSRPGSRGWAAYPAPQQVEVYDQPPPGDDLGGISLDAILSRRKAPVVGGAGPRFGGYGFGIDRSGAIGIGQLGTIGHGAGGGGIDKGLPPPSGGSAGVGEPAEAAASKGPPPPSAGRAGEGKAPGAVVPVFGAADRRRLTRDQGPRRDREREARGWHLSAGRSKGAPPGFGSRVYPVALHHDGDPRLDDLTEYVPALFSSAFDLDRARLLRRADLARGAITPDARQLVERSRRRMLGRRYAAADQSFIALDGEGHFVSEGADLPREQVVYDGADLFALYPELDLAVRRRVGATESALLFRYAPFVLARPDALARFYAVSRRARTLVLALPTSGEAVLEIDLDQEDRPVEVRRLSGPARGVWYRFEYDGDRMVVAGEGDRVELEVSPEEVDVPDDPGTGRTLVKMPLRRPAYWDREQPPPGADGWRVVQRQLLASYAALGDTERTRAVVASLAGETAALTAGELVLASRALRRAEPRAFEAALSGIGGHPVALYLKAIRASGTPALDKLAASAGHDLVGELASYRGLLRALSRGAPRDSVLARQRRFAARFDDPRLRFIAAYMVHQRYRWETPEAAAAGWDQVADSGPWWALAQIAAARALSGRGAYDAAVERYQTVYEKSAEVGGRLPPVDSAAKNAFLQSSRGEAGWRLFWSRWRTRVFSSGDPDLLLVFLRSARLTGQGDFERAAARAVAMQLDDRETLLRLVDTFLDLGRVEQARAILEPALERARDRGRPDPALLRRASRVAEREGRLAGAAALLGRATAAAARDPEARWTPAADARELAELYARLALGSSGARRDEMVERALDAIAAWRRVDPVNPALDRRAASLLFAVGRPEEARRYLTTAIERRPGEGSAYQTVAQALEAEGRVEEAEPMWARAAELEPEDPTWLLHRAQALLALGRRDDARPVLEKIAAGSWHARFAGVVARAKELTAN